MLNVKLALDYVTVFTVRKLYIYFTAISLHLSTLNEKDKKRSRF